MPLHLTSSNRFEPLLETLLARMARGGNSAFEPERIIVPAMGVRRTIELAAADRHGICANVQFRFLAQWVWEQIAKVVPGVDETSPFAPARLSWRIFRALGDSAFSGAHPMLARYLERADELMRYELAQRIATLFDQYITYRPGWLDAWSANRLVAGDAPADAFEHESWQAALWRRLAMELGTVRQHPSIAFFKAMRSGTIDARAVGLPELAHVFCLPSIPPLYAQMLRELARWTDLYVYIMNPCEEYWAEIIAPRRLAEEKVRRRGDHHEVGNRLLAQWGSQTEASLRVMLETWEGATIAEASAYVTPASDTLLASLQRSMLELTELEPGSLGIRDDDRSIEVHVCHSLTRELEVLQDQLLAMFVADSSLEASDVLVVTPALQEAAPLIEAVFENVGGARRIPFEITGRARSTRNSAARALLDLLTLATSRFHASAVFDLLQQGIVARRFDLGASALDRIRSWMREAGIRWALDGEHRLAFDLPALARHSFADGLDRLFLGYALPSGMQAALAETLPAGNVEGSEAVDLGNFWRVVRMLDDVREDAARPRSMAQWLQIVQRLTGSFLQPEDDEMDDMRELESGLRMLHDEVRGAADTTLIGLDVLRAALVRTLDDPVRGGVPGGRVTFASMASLRNLPYRVICAIGLDDGAFPSTDRPLEFDLIAAAPRPGDRQRRAEDRNVFLDLVLAARERLYLSHTGRNIRDNASLPPSVLLADLLDVLLPAIADDPRTQGAIDAARSRLVVEHPLQPFSARYFEVAGEPRIRSFNHEYCEALQQRVGRLATLHSARIGPDIDEADEIAREPEDAFFKQCLEEPGDEWRVVPVHRLIQFFCNPCRYLLKQRLGLGLPAAEDELEDDEPFLPDWRAPGALASRVLADLLEGADPGQVRALARAGIEYPPGAYGEHLLDQELASLHVFASSIRQHTRAPVLDPVSGDIAFEIGGHVWRLQGAISDLRTNGLVRYRYDDVRAVDYVQGWIEHLFLNALDTPADPRTLWQSRDGSYLLPPIADARARLHELLTLYSRGLRAPLHFFPKSAWCLVTKGGRVGAERQWFSTVSHRYGEDRDASYQLCLRGVENPLDEAFEGCARTVFAPLVAVIQDLRLEPA
ncbi:MAG: exodeoxyribonuclease V subunit gamma [Pseudomonadota bacterium]|nr:exodeoxyribonuclease V subunit gamma [Pseudomonadota bacterium]